MVSNVLTNTSGSSELVVLKKLAFFYKKYGVTMLSLVPVLAAICLAIYAFAVYLLIYGFDLNIHPISSLNEVVTTPIGSSFVLIMNVIFFTQSWLRIKKEQSMKSNVFIYSVSAAILWGAIFVGPVFGHYVDLIFKG